MVAMTNYLENKLLDHALGTTAYTAPTNVYVKLHIGDPGEDATGFPAVEATRKVTGSFAAAAAGTTDNDALIEWLSVSTTEVYSHISIWDAATLGNPLFYGALTSTVSMTAGDDFQLPAASLALTFD